MPSHRRIARLLWLPKLALLLLLGAVLSLLWVLHHNERSEQRATLISDVLWLEQNLHFELENAAEHLQQMALDMSRQKPAVATQTFDVRGNHQVKNVAAITHVAWTDASGRLRRLAPVGGAPLPSTTLLTEAATRASKLQRPQYIGPYLAGDHPRLAIVVTAQNAASPYTLLALLDLDSLLKDAVPWWFTQKYQVRLINDAGHELARKSNLDVQPSDDDNLTYELMLDPPGEGLKLSVTAYQSTGNTSQRLLTIAIVLLALGVFSSLWVLRNQMKRRQHTEEALRAEYAFRESMENSLTAGMRARDLEGTMTYVNPAFCRMTGFTRDELIGRKPPMPYWPPEHLEETYSLHRAVLSGHAPQDGFEVELRRKNGQPFRALIYEAPLIDGKGQHIGWMGSVLDVTERHKAEELARQQAEKLQATARLVTLGEMASTLAHELNQPLAAITSYNSGCLNLLEQNSPDPIPEKLSQPIQQALQKLGAQAQRAGRIIRRVHEFVKKREPRRAPCALADIIEDSVGFSEAEARKHGALIEVQMPEGLPLIDADRLMIEQVLLNLIRNGLEAMRNTPATARKLLLQVDAKPDGATIQVRDFGQGVPPELRENLFNAFYTTKPEGLGIGLSICRSIVEFHRGRLWLEQPPDGTGSIFAFTLPWADPELEAAHD